MSYRMRVRYRTSISASRSACSPLPHRQKVQLAGERTPYISVQDDEEPAEIFLRVNGADCSSELLGLYEAIARLMSLALQHGAPPLEKVGDLLADAKFEPCGPVVGQDRLTHGSSLPNRIGRHRLMVYCDRDGHYPSHSGKSTIGLRINLPEATVFPRIDVDRTRSIYFESASERALDDFIALANPPLFE